MTSLGGDFVLLFFFSGIGAMALGGVGGERYGIGIWSFHYRAFCKYMER